MIGLTQLLPGPASSQTGFLIGVCRGGIAGGIAAWFGFTLPSALLMILFAASLRYAGNLSAHGAVHGLQIAAVAVVANATYRMFRVLCPDVARALLAIASAVFVWFSAGSLSQVVAIATGAVVGALFFSLPSSDSVAPTPISVRPSVALSSIALFVVLLAALQWSGTPLLQAFFRTGSLVFGGGHVVLPLLEQAVVQPGWVAQSDFLAGYGAAQALPGPLFTFAAFLGYVSRIPPNHISGALLCLFALFLPGLLLALAAAPLWHRVLRTGRTRSMLAGVNATVVGLLLAATVQAARSGAIRHWTDAAASILLLVLLLRTHIPVVALVLGSAALFAGAAVIA